MMLKKSRILWVIGLLSVFFGSRFSLAGTVHRTLSEKQATTFLNQINTQTPSRASRTYLNYLSEIARHCRQTKSNRYMITRDKDHKDVFRVSTLCDTKPTAAVGSMMFILEIEMASNWKVNVQTGHYESMGLGE